MCERSFILNVCFLIALVSTNPIPQEVDVQTYPGNYCDQSAFRNTLIGLFNEEQTNDELSNSIASICSNHQKNDILMKIIHDRIINNPILVDIINDIHRSNNADILNGIQKSKSTPNIVNNYIIIPDFYNGQTSNIKEDIYKECPLNSPSICTRVKKNADKNQDDLGESTNYKQTDVEVTKGEENKLINVNQNTSDNQTMNSQKRNTRKRLKRPPEAKTESTHVKIDNQSIDSIDLLVTEDAYQRVNKTKKSKIKTTNEISSKDKPIKSEVTENSQKEKKVAENTIKNQQNKTLKTTTSRKKINGVRLKHGKLINSKTKTLNDGGQKKKSKEIQTNKNDSRNKQKISDSNQSRNAFNSVPITQDYQFPNMPYDSNSMYKYINAIMSNYQSGNNDFKDFPFNFSNFYQLPQLSHPRSGKKPGRSKSYKRRKHPKFYRRRNNRKRVYSRRKPIDKLVINEPVDDIISSSKTDDITPLNSLEIKENPSITNVAVTQNNDTAITENVSKQKENISSDENEKENFVTSIFNESLISNSLPEETLYNPYPSFIVGIDDKVPIIFENSLMDDYYPDFTADEALQLRTEETNPIKYHGDKYNYVSNKNFNFGDFIKKRKRIAMKNMSKNSNLFFSESEGIKNFTLKQEDKESKEKIGAQKSPHFLDKPDFRTRKIDSNEIYEPYHYHNIYQDPEEGYNKYDVEDTAVVYSSPMSDKNNVKTKSCNDVEDGLAKWRKNKDLNVETVHARSKLAKYGLAL